MTIVIISSLIIIGFLIFALIKKPMMTISVLVIVVIGILVCRLIWSFLPIPIGIRHLAHLIAPPEDLYQPIIVDKFLFYEKGFTKTYSLKPTYLDIYEIGFSVGGEGITSKYKFKGKLKVEFFWKDKFLFNDVITKWKQAWDKENDMTHFKEISLYKFDMPLKGKYKNDVSVKITVLEPDDSLKELSDLIGLYIKVSPYI
jgi:hypothetical protein